MFFLDCPDFYFKNFVHFNRVKQRNVEKALPLPLKAAVNTLISLAW